MKKVIIINKCQDCKYRDCKLRVLCGGIPDECPLFDASHWLSDMDIEKYEIIEKCV